MGDESSMIKIGPFGSKSGNAWDEKGHDKLVQIFISHDDEINSLQFQYSQSGTLALSETHGTNDGSKFDVHPVVFTAVTQQSVVTAEDLGPSISMIYLNLMNGDGLQVKLNHPTEYISWISGHKSSSNSHLCSITFGTNKGGEYGPFGKFTAHDKEFVFKLGEDRQFGGFHGTADNNSVKSIGVYLRPNTTLNFDFTLNKNVLVHDTTWETVE